MMQAEKGLQGLDGCVMLRIRKTRGTGKKSMGETSFLEEREK